ncbi:ubiquinone biosynthesis protein-like protein [Angomonas deanei]|nr:ubiquinone biosynthesis protein-like protein [Angomonas deanei]|eukprot:EPY41541.1 ubiquinone biosynthesis protein-like protein [Angomonas deanei]
MMADITGRTILTHRPRVTDSVLEAARKMDENSFGRRYAAYMDHNKFLPSGRTPVQHIADPTLSYIMTRYRECHDFLHTITDCGRTVEEEVAVKLLEFQHTGLPLGLLAVLGGAPHMSAAQRQQVREYWRWAQANRPNGTHGERFINCYLNIMWEDLLPRPHAEVVREVGITPLKEFLK